MSVLEQLEMLAQLEFCIDTFTNNISNTPCPLVKPVRHLPYRFHMPYRFDTINNTIQIMSCPFVKSARQFEKAWKDTYLLLTATSDLNRHEHKYTVMKQNFSCTVVFDIRELLVCSEGKLVLPLTRMGRTKFLP